MPILTNPRHEKFAQGLAQGKPATEAYQNAGYAPNDGNCIRLKGYERVRSRVAELQAAGAERAEVTLEGLITEALSVEEWAEKWCK
jgi:phage terminase small subunit